MKIVNNSGVSSGLFRALSEDDYDKGDARISATQLITPPRIVQLHERHEDEIEEDASDVVYRMLGKTIHGILEKVKLSMAGPNTELRNLAIMKILEDFDSGEVAIEDVPEKIKQAIEDADSKKVLESHGVLFENRLFAEVNGWKISGCPDELDLQQASLKDYKLCSVWSVMDGESKEEWTQQLNIYAWLAAANGHHVEKAEIEAIFRDWSKGKALRSKEDGYPKAQTKVFPITLWPHARQDAFVRERVRVHQEAAALADDLLPICTEKERWAVGNKWAIEKAGRKSAVKLCDTREEAIEWIKTHQREGEVLSISKRSGESTRCLLYCPVWRHCKFGQFVHGNQ